MRAALPLLSFALLLAGCGQAPQQVGGKPRTGRLPKIVSLSPGTTELVASTFDARFLAGRTKADNYPATVSKIPVVAEVKPDFEAIQKIAPNMVVYDADLYNDADVKRIEGMGAKPFAFKDRTLEGFERELHELAAQIGSETTVNDYVSRIERAVNEASPKPSPTPKVAIVLGGYVAGTRSFLADVVRTVGGEPVGPDADKFAPMSPEALVGGAPDVIVLPTTKATAEKDVAALKAQPGVVATPAFKNGRIVALEQDVVLRRGARVDKLVKDLYRAIVRETQK